MGGSSRSHRKSLKLPPPMSTANIHLYTSQFPLKGILRTSWTPAPQKRIKRTTRQITEAERCSYQKCTPGVVTHSKEESHQMGAYPGGAKGWHPTSGTPAPGIYSREMSLQNAWLRKIKGAVFQGSQNATGNWDSLLKRLLCNLTHHYTQENSSLLFGKCQVLRL